MALLDLLGRRWALRVLWELRGGEALAFRPLAAACGGISPTVLMARLDELRNAAIVELSDEGYRLTAEGRSLIEALAPLSAWAARWSRR
jgi:DNA-binding HxlR family transcriptional regulator